MIAQPPVSAGPAPALTLLVLAAGLGERYGGLKQLEPVGPDGETVIDYAVAHAMQAGFSRVIFVIRAEFAAVFKAQIGSKYEAILSVGYALQDVDDLPKGHTRPPGRSKPWGTAHAVWAARALLDGPFALVNGDDFYGHQAYQDVAEFLLKIGTQASGPAQLQCCMVAYRLGQTLSAHGGVNRGICHSADGWLMSVEEHTSITMAPEGICRGRRLDGQMVALAPQALVSMNCWGFNLAVLPAIEANLTNFLEQFSAHDSAECFIPSVIDQLLRTKRVNCRILSTESRWFGMTYPQDKALCAEHIRQLVANSANRMHRAPHTQ